MIRFLRRRGLLRGGHEGSQDECLTPAPDKRVAHEFPLSSLGRTYSGGDEDVYEEEEGQAKNKADVARQYAIASIANLLMLSFGIVTGWSATSLHQLMSYDTPLPQGPLSPTHGTWLASLFAITGIPLAPLLVIAIERWGRKPLAFFTAITLVLSHLTAAIGISIATSSGSQTVAIVALYISRTLAGFSTAGGFMFTPLYSREISDNETRGTLGVLITLNINVGTLCAYVFGGYCSFVLSCWLYSIPPLIFLAAYYWIPETPVYLLRKEREEEAEKALTLLRGEDYDVGKEITEIKESLSRMRANAQGGLCSNLKEIFSSAASRKAFLIIVFLMFNKEFSGQFCITSYTAQIFEEAETKLEPRFLSIIVGIMLVIGTIIAAFLCNLLGRKLLLIISNVVMAVSLFGLGMYFYFKYSHRDLSHVTWTPVTFMSIYVIAYNIGLGPLPLVLLTELFNPKVVSTAMIFIGPIPGILAFITGKFIYQVAEAIGLYSCFWGFAGVCTLGIIFVFILVPETKNRSLDEIQLILAGGSIMNGSLELPQDDDMTDIPLSNHIQAVSPIITDL